MPVFNIEHIGLTVTDPVAMAEWYRDVLGFTIAFSGADDEKAVAFIIDAGGKIMLELGKLPGIAPLADRIDHHLQAHIALLSDDPLKDAAYLESKGATFIEKCPVTRPGELLVVLRDPWGITIQLVRRSSA